MKIDLGSKPYNDPVIKSAPEKEKHVPYYPSTELEGEDISADMLGKDIKCEVTIRVTRAEIVAEAGKPKKTRFRLEFRKIDFPDAKLKDQDLQDDITDAIEGINETKAQEASEKEDDEEING